MRPKHAAWLLAALLVAVGALVAIGPGGVAPARAGDSGVLKLKVCTCTGSWLSNAEVEVIINRPGSGQVDSNSGYTNSSGYISLQFSGLEHEDEAQVIVTPDGGSPDSDHKYVWLSDYGDADDPQWDIVPDLQLGCPDSWFDQEQNIIRCKVDG